MRLLICENFSDKNSKFVTLTFNDSMDFDIKDPKQCNKAFKTFIQRLKWRHPDLQYIAVIEFQDKNGRGAVHYHMICNLPVIPKSELSEIWGNGFVKINAIDKVDNLGAYVVKYMCEDLHDNRLMGLKAYNCSKGLQRPQEQKSWDCESQEQYYELKRLIEKLTPSYSAKYESETAGAMEYIQYNLQRQNTTK